MAVTNKQDAARERAKDAPPDTYIRVAVGYGMEVVLPLEAGLEMMACFAKAEKYASSYVDGRTVIHIGGSLPEINMSLISGTDYMTGKLNGEKTA